MFQNLDAKSNMLKRNDAKSLLSKYGILIALVVLIVVLSIATPNFLQIKNFLNVFRQISISAILAIGATFVVLTGGIDLSLGAMVAITGVSAAMFAHPGEYPTVVPVLVGIGVGVLFGLFIGVIVAKANVASFIVTLGVTTIARGGALLIADGRPVSNLDPSFNWIGNGEIGGAEGQIGFPVMILIMLAVFLVVWFVLNKTKYGRYVYAIGGNEEAAYASGVKVDRVKMSVYVICSGLAGLAGVMQAARIEVGQPSIGVGYELDAIAAVVIGGTSLSGGVGTVVGTLIGALIIGFINNGLDLLNVSSYYQQIIKGLIIIGAVLLDVKTKQKR